MTPTTLAPPPASAPPAPPALPSRAPLRPRRSPRFRGGVPRPVWIGTVLFHLLLILLAGRFLRFGIRDQADEVVWTGPEEVPVTFLDIRGTPAVDGIAPVPAPLTGAPAAGSAPDTASSAPVAAPPRARGPAPAVPSAPGGVSRPVAPATGSGAGAAGGGGAAPGRGAAGVLRPGLRDPRLVVTPRELPPPPEPTEHERYMAQLEGELGVIRDSIADEQERARRVTDWTVKDKNGKRWGISPGQVHLGGVAIPLPIGGAPAPSEQDRQRSEILRQADDYDRDQTVKERARATRERKNAEREKRRGGG